MILIVAEYAAGKLSNITREMVTAARALSSELAILVLGSAVSAIADQAATLAPQVLVADRAELQTYDPELWSAAVAQIAKEGEADTILIAGSRGGREFSPRVAVALEAALLENVTTLARTGTKTTATRYAYLARVAQRVAVEATPIVVTVQPGAFAAAAPSAEKGEQFDVDLTLPAPRVHITGRTTERSTRVALAEADIVVAGGRGVGSAEGFTQYVEALAEQLGAAVGATRAIVDAGWRPYSEQVGQTGKTVQPKAYVALGISGAVQHLSGMNKSRFIVAINKDADSPIFKVADLGIVGSVAEVVPPLLAVLKRPA